MCVCASAKLNGWANLNHKHSFAVCVERKTNQTVDIVWLLEYFTASPSPSLPILSYFSVVFFESHLLQSHELTEFIIDLFPQNLNHIIKRKNFEWVCEFVGVCLCNKRWIEWKIKWAIIKTERTKEKWRATQFWINFWYAESSTMFCEFSLAII